MSKKWEAHLRDKFPIADRIPVKMPALEDQNYADYDSEYTGSRLRDANLISSLTEEGTHQPVLDLDIPCKLVPSSTPGHSHLYIDHDLTPAQYEYLLTVLVDVGIIQPGFKKQFTKRGATFVRPPWVEKGGKPKADPQKDNDAIDRMADAIYSAWIKKVNEQIFGKG